MTNNESQNPTRNKLLSSTLDSNNVHEIISTYLTNKKRSSKITKDLVHGLFERDRKEKILTSLRKELHQFKELNERYKIYLNLLTKSRKENEYNYRKLKKRLDEQQAELKSYFSVSETWEDQREVLAQEKQLIIMQSTEKIKDLGKEKERLISLEERTDRQAKVISYKVDEQEFSIKKLMKKKNEQYEENNYREKEFVQDVKTINNKIKQAKNKINFIKVNSKYSIIPEKCHREEKKRIKDEDLTM